MNLSSYQKFSFLLLRVFSSLIFIVAGINHIFQTENVAARLNKSSLGYLATGLASAESLVMVAGLGLLLFGALFLLGLKTRLAAIGLISILLPITITVQLTNPAGYGPLFKNIALIGVLLFFALNGALFYGVDQWLKRKPAFLFRNKGTIAFMLVSSLVFLGACSGDSPDKSSGSVTNGAITERNYALLISQPNHLKAAVHAANQMTAESDFSRKEFIVVACGKSVQALVKGNALADTFDNGKKAGIRYRVCGLSLKKLGIEPDTLMAGIEVVPNGITEMFRLKNNGYTTIEL